MNKSFLFIGGCPRSGTSLLSVLIGNLPGVRMVQDLCFLYYLKYAAMYTMYSLNGVSFPDLNIKVASEIPRFDLRYTEFFPAFLNASLEQCLNERSSANGLVLRTFIERMDWFLFEAFNVPDPRKDRKTGASYLRNFDLPKMFECSSMRDLCLEILDSSASSLVDSPDFEFSLVCDKTPENNVALDVIDLVMDSHCFRYLQLVRDPVSVYGARRQRVDSGVVDFVSYFKDYSEASLDASKCIAKTVVRYEDITRCPRTTLESALSDLDILNLVGDSFELPGQLSPGKYISYVGSSIDLDRDRANREMVSEEEKSYIYETLASFCEKYSYGPYSNSI